MFKDLDRVIIAVKDLEKSKDFFEDLFDIEFDVFEGHEGLKIRGAYSASKLELIEPYGDDSFLHKYLEKKGEGIMGIVVRVKDIDAASLTIARVRSTGTGVRLTGAKIAGDAEILDVDAGVGADNAPNR